VERGLVVSTTVIPLPRRIWLSGGQKYRPEMAMRMKKILSMILHEAHGRQIEEIIKTCA
jgi:hypothetical protein